ncbi:MAG TPA: hypothetical protein VLS85_13580 [Hanamia sp.]|nr:hypothetical protein [Hanamia sp.]
MMIVIILGLSILSFIAYAIGYYWGFIGGLKWSQQEFDRIFK